MSKKNKQRNISVKLISKMIFANNSIKTLQDGIMATSSIDNHVVIKDDEIAKRLIDAIEYADKHPSNIKHMTDEEMGANTKRTSMQISSIQEIIAANNGEMLSHMKLKD
ncbi:MAG: hypothetical protein LBT79_00955 [Elusimicrobiota bacterium]|jgi:hypothetical protein|nr:hypothetical protein [Elusimicrobiota bacterium]